MVVYCPAGSRVSTAPVDGPLTIAEGKLRAGLDWVDGDPRDALMLSCIRTARAKVEHDTGVALVEQTIEYLFDGISSGAELQLPLRPVTAAVVESIDAQGVVHPLADAAVRVRDYGVRPVAPRVRLTSDPWPTDLSTATAPWIVRVTVGFEDVADLAAAAPELLHAVGLLVAHYATYGRDLAIVGTIVATPFGYDDLIAPYRLVSL